MARPSEQPEWADGGSAVRVNPTTGKKQKGWARKEKPAAEILNWYMYTVFLWIQWLAAGILDGNWEFTGNVQIDGAVDCESTLNVDGVVTVGDKLTATELHYTSVEEIIIPCQMSIATGFGIGGAAIHTRTSPGQVWTLANNADPIIFPIPIAVGRHIRDFTVYVNKGSNASTTLNAQLWYQNSATGGAETHITGVDGTNSANAPGFVTLTNSAAVDETMVNGRQYYLKVFLSGTLVANDLVLHALVGVTKP